MTSPLEQPSYADLIQQMGDLRAQIAQPLTLDDLPLGDLRGALIENGPPLDLSVLALSHSLTADQLPFRYAAGLVDGTGAILGGTANFTVVRNALGDYTVTFASGLFTAAPVVVSAAQTGTAVVAKPWNGVPVTATTARFAAVTSAGAAADSSFHFIAIGSV